MLLAFKPVESDECELVTLQYLPILAISARGRIKLTHSSPVAVMLCVHIGIFVEVKIRLCYLCLCF